MNLQRRGLLGATHFLKQVAGRSQSTEASGNHACTRSASCSGFATYYFALYLWDYIRILTLRRLRFEPPRPDFDHPTCVCSLHHRAAQRRPFTREQIIPLQLWHTVGCASVLAKLSIPLHLQSPQLSQNKHRLSFHRLPIPLACPRPRPT